MKWPAACADDTTRESGPRSTRAPKSRRCAARRDLNQPIEQLYLHRFARLDRAAPVLEHDEAIGLGHGAQHARALRAGRAYAPPPLIVARQDAAREFGAARTFLDCGSAGGLRQGQGK